MDWTVTYVLDGPVERVEMESSHGWLVLEVTDSGFRHQQVLLPWTIRKNIPPRYILYHL